MNSRLMKCLKSSFATATASLALVASSCGGDANERDSAARDARSWFRTEPRPAFEKTIRAADLAPFMEQGGAVLDVRLEEDYALDPGTIPGAQRRDPDQIAEWARRIPKDRPIALYCVKGKWVSQKAAAYLADQGFDVYSVEGGLEAWKAQTPGRQRDGQ
jgi:rhodanese-related sulfurtransferase